MANARQAARARQSTGSGQANGNGNQTTAEQQKLAEAIAHEEAIREEAAAIWADEANAGKGLAELLPLLRPLLRRPIPQGFTEHVPKVDGKPYESTGVKSVQVQMDRLDNVLGPQSWGYEATYSEGGKLCHVRAWVGWDDEREVPLIERDSYGGVRSAPVMGNLYKGSFTNAAKLALARLGPAWEVYVGAADFDPDTDKSAAEAQGAGGAMGQSSGEPRPLSADNVRNLQAAVHEADLEEHLGAKLRSFGVAEIKDLTVDQGMELWAWAQGAKAE